MSSFTSQVDFIFFGMSAQSHLKMSDCDSEFAKYNSSDHECDFEGLTQANICKATAAYATMAGLITSLEMAIDTTDDSSVEEHSCDLDNSKSNVYMDEVSYVFV